jgi:hypothetical protein
MIPDFLHRPEVLGIGEIGLNKNGTLTLSRRLNHIGCSSTALSDCRVHFRHTLSPDLL